MQDAEKLFIAFDYNLTLDSGEQIDCSEANEPFDFITGSDQIIPGLEKALVAMKVGDAAKVTVAPEEAYGPYMQDLVHEIPRDQFPPEEQIEPGMNFQTEGPHGPLTINVIAVKGDESVTVDLNHPLAGKTLIFDVKIAEIREASAEEIEEALTADDGCGCGCGSESQGGACGSDCGCGSDSKSGSCGCS
jgi:FKBP-type peptidyl-prolyl cis-trans isomerase SlyD